VLECVCNDCVVNACFYETREEALKAQQTLPLSTRIEETRE
jgi:hypothetical protein